MYMREGRERSMKDKQNVFILVWRKQEHFIYYFKERKSYKISLEQIVLHSAIMKQMKQLLLFFNES